jgi:uncharacterized membrane protein
METGYVGFLLVAMILLNALVVALLSYLRASKEDGGQALVLFVSMCAFSFLMSNVALYGWGQQSYMMWIMVALCMRLPRLRASEPNRASLPAPTAAAVPTISGFYA